MTFETCIKQAENCRKHNDEAGALVYEARAERKKNLTRAYYENQARVCEERGDGESAVKWRDLALKKLNEKPKAEPKETPKNGKK